MKRVAGFRCPGVHVEWRSNICLIIDVWFLSKLIKQPSGYLLAFHRLVHLHRILDIAGD